VGVCREGVLHQYYGKDRIGTLLGQQGFKALSVEKLKYSWTHEHGTEPDPSADGARAEPPWDWLVLAQVEPR